MKENASLAEMRLSLEVAPQSLLLLEAYLIKIKVEILFRTQNSGNMK